jgi:single-stranded-DNA-specific exonuclease
VGVAFYLIIALRAHLRQVGFWHARQEPNLKALCDLVAVGTVADVAPLIRENRALTAAGIQQLNQRSRPGMAALMRMSGLSEAPIDAESIAFKLAPRLNAAGRLAHARMACELLLTTDPQRAERLAGALCRLNNRRQSMESELLESILDRLDRRADECINPAIVVYGDGWHEGVLGIVAARLTRQFHRPAVVISSRNGTAKGSARSIEGIDIAAALGQCAGLLDRYGGHPQAAGLSLQSNNLEAFKSHLEAVVGQMVAKHGTQATVTIDAHLPLGDVTPALMASLERLGPFGQGNPYPLFMDTGVRVAQSQSIGSRHRKMILTSGSGRAGQLQAIQFNVSQDQATGKPFEKIAYRPQWNYWNGRKRLQVIVEETVPDA